MIGNDKDYLTTRVSYKLNLKRAERHRADRLLDLAGRGPPGLPEPAERRVRHGAGRRRDDPSRRSGYLYQTAASSRPTATAGPSTRRRAGTVDGSGAGIVVLKRLEDALADGDRIYAVIRGSAINNDGSLKVGYTAPSVDGQAAVIAEALAHGGRRRRRRSAMSRRTAPARRWAIRSRSPR